MKIFSKLVNSYFITIKEILTFAKLEGDITRAEIEVIIDREAFLESHIYLIPNLIKSNWPFLKINDSKTYNTVLKNVPKRPFTNLELSWLKTVSCDEKFKVFFTDDELETINEFLKNVKPLFSLDDIYYFDQSKHSDPYKNEEYRKIFRTIIKSFENNKIIEVLYISSKRKKYMKKYIPIKLEYSEKDNVFRLYTKSVENVNNVEVLRLNRIVSVNITDEYCDYKKEQKDLHKYLLSKEPAVLKINNIRNSLERTMLQFASYKKKTEYNEERNYFVCKIWYNHLDETDLLIRILSFGHSIEILSPKKLRAEGKKRILNQYNLLFNVNENYLQ